MSHLPPEGKVKSSEYKPGVAPEDENRDHYENVETGVDLEVLNREKAEPYDFYNPIPLWWVLGLLVMLGWAGWYIDKYADGWTSTKLDVPSTYFQQGGGGGGTDGTPPVETDIKKIGAKVFGQRCASCHQANGAGVPGQYPPLVASEWVSGEPEVMAAIILKGVKGEMTVKGNLYNGNMQAWGQLSDKQIAGVMSYLRADARFENNVSEVTPEFVAMVRAHHSARTAQWSEAELLKVKEEAPARREAFEGDSKKEEAPAAEGESEAKPEATE